MKRGFVCTVFWKGGRREPTMPMRFKGEFRQNYRHTQGMFLGVCGAFVDLSRLGSLVWHRYSCWGLGPS